MDTLPPPTGPSDATGRQPDPGSPGLASLAWGLIAALLTLTIVLQQTGWGTGGNSRSQETSKPAAAAAPADPWPAVEATPMGRLALRLMRSSQSLGPDIVMNTAESAARGDLDQLRLVMIERAVRGPGAETLRLEALVERLQQTTRASGDADLHGALGGAASSESRLLAETLLVRRALRDGPSKLTEPERRGLEARHGPLGRLVLTDDQPGAPERDAILSGGPNLLAWGATLIFAVLLATVVGAIVLVAGIVRARNGDLALKFTPPAPGGSVLLETVVVFIAGFLILKVASIPTTTALGGWIGWPFVLQWLLLLTVFWPLLRGAGVASWRQMLGLQWGGTARGFMREVWAGVLGYLCMVPLFVMGTVINLVVMRIKSAIDAGAPAGGASSVGGGGTGPVLPDNPLIDLVGRLSGWELALFVLLAVVWAPLVEELIFRGAMFRHLRSRWGLAVSAVASAMVFGLMHGYAWYLLTPVVMLGLGFALIRQWRGSIIACMTAHAIHNGIVTTVLVAALSG